jgi:hypothetical protein
MSGTSLTVQGVTVSAAFEEQAISGSCPAKQKRVFTEYEKL